ncbi:MAG TPA: hypothetical protein VK281_13520, partial [Xanthobacteraceae bacterium]|nr:hypothetical protein [Xanthobacteraceae bacterium]
MTGAAARFLFAPPLIWCRGEHPEPGIDAGSRRTARARGTAMRYLHTMLRVRNLDDALDFY